MGTENVRKLLRVAVIAYITYLALTLLVITPALNYFPHRYLKNTYGWELRTGWVLLNPFKVSLDIRDAALVDEGGAPFLAFHDASVDLSMSSLWKRAWVLDRVRLHDLALDVVRLTQDTYNFSDLLAGGTEVPEGTASAATAAPASDADTATAGGSALPPFIVHEVDLHAARIALTDQARKTPYSSRWNGLQVRVTNLSSVDEAAQPFSVEIAADAGGSLQWQGEISLARGESSGRWALADLDLVNLWRYGEPWLALELKGGRLSSEGEYQVNWAQAPAYRISNGRIALAGLDIQPKDPQQLPDTAVSGKTLEIGGIGVDGAGRKVTLDSVTLDAPSVSTWLEENRVSLQDLFAVTLPESKPAEADNGPPWSVALNTMQVRAGQLHWRSAYTDPQQLDIQPLEFSVEHLTWPLTGDTRLALKLTANQQANIALNGALALAAGTGDLEYTLDGLPLTWFSPNLPKPLKLTITGGQVAVQGRVALVDFAPTTIQADVKVREFAARQTGEETAFTSFDLLHLDGVSVDMAQHSVALRKISLDTYSGRLHIHKDGSINASAIWKEEVGAEVEQVAEELTASKPWTFSVPLIQISDSALDFMDESLPIQFRTVVGDLEGEVRDLSSDPATAARVDISGSVDGYAPVALKGEVAPMASPTDLDLRLTFDGVDMALLSPYTGNYAGYKIDRGLLDLDLHYSLRNNQLQGDNSVRIEKLKLGEKVESDKAVDLPLELALAILTDANGVIDLAVPVKGDVDNPEFDIGGLITKAIVNVITKVITAPFTLLAGLADTEDDLQRITFSAGSSTLSDKNKAKLAELATALAQRPKLSLVVTGRLNLTRDRERLQRDALKARLLEGGLSAEDIKARNPEWEEAIADLYGELPAEAKATTEIDAREQSTLVAKNIAVTDQQLAALAGQRAVAVKLFLATEAGLPAERAVVGQSSLMEDENTFSGVELSIGT